MLEIHLGYKSSELMEVGRLRCTATELARHLVVYTVMESLSLFKVLHCNYISDQERSSLKAE